jgi:hypothetical protein
MEPMSAFQEDFLQTIVNVNWGPNIKYWCWANAYNGGSAPPTPPPTPFFAPASPAQAAHILSPSQAFTTPVGTLTGLVTNGGNTILATVPQRKAMVDSRYLFSTLTGLWLPGEGGPILLSVSWIAYFAVGRYLLDNPKLKSTSAYASPVSVCNFTISAPFNLAAVQASGAADLSDPNFQP